MCTHALQLSIFCGPILSTIEGYPFYKENWVEFTVYMYICVFRDNQYNVYIYFFAHRTEDADVAPDNTDFGQTNESTSDISVLQELCPNVDPQQILLSLQENNGNLDLTAQDLLGIPSHPVDGRVDR